MVEINDESVGGFTTGGDIKFKAKFLSFSLCDYADAYILAKGKIMTGAEDDDAARRADERGGYTTGGDIKFKAKFLSFSLCDYADAYILVKGKIITGAEDDDAARRADERNIGVIFKNCASFMKCISKINDTEIYNSQDTDIVMPVYNLIEYSDKYSTKSESSWQYYKDESNDNLATSESFKSKVKISGTAITTPCGGNTKNVKINVPLKYLGNFWKTLEMPLINCEVIFFNMVINLCYC